MDGSGVIQLLLPEEVSRRWQLTARQPLVGIIGILVAWRFFGYLMRPVFSFVLSLLLL